MSGLLLLAAVPAHAQVSSLGKGWLLDVAGSITSAPGELIAGNNSIKGSYSGPASFTIFLGTDPTFITFAPSQSYTITFRYRVITALSAGLQFGFFSKRGAGNLLNDPIISPAAGSSGTATGTITLLPYTDYQIQFKLVGTGTIAIDDVQVTDSGSRLVASENAEGPTLVPGLLDFQLTDAIALLPDASGVPVSAAVKDLDGDGYPETILTLASPRPGNIPSQPIIIESSARMRLATSDFFPGGAPTVKDSPMTLFADINNDGLPDILFSDAGSDPIGPGSAIAVGLNLGGGKYQNVQPLIPADQQSSRSYAIAVGDVLSDGHVEIIEPDENDGSNTVLLRWNGSGFDEIRNWIPQSMWKDRPYYMHQQSWMVLADLDQDGKQDLLVTGQGINPDFQIVFGAGGPFTAAGLVVPPDGPFGHVPPTSNPPPVIHTTGEVSPVLVADFNNDGKPDIFAIEREQYIYQPGVFTDTDYPAYADIHANGGSVPVNSTFQVLINQGARRFMDVTSPSYVNLGRREYSNLFAIDINNDGFLDVVGLYQADNYAGVRTQWGTTVFLNDGTGAFQVVDGADLLAAVSTTPSNGQRWNLGLAAK